MDPYAAYAHLPGAVLPLYSMQAPHASTSTDGLHTSMAMSDDVRGQGIPIGTGAAPVYLSMNNFLLGSYTAYGRHDHQASVPNATVNDSPSRAMIQPATSSIVPMLSTFGYSLTSSAWLAEPVFSYPTPQFDAPVAGPSNVGGSFRDKSWPEVQVAEQEHSLPSYQSIPPTASTSNMAILHHTETTPPIPPNEPESNAYQAPTDNAPAVPDAYADIINYLPTPGDNTALERGGDGKRHACGMCHKSFDRPCTLRKHMLVHTGEKAYQCDSCGRRFGVASNLNRHRKRCGHPRAHRSGSHDSSPQQDESNADNQHREAANVTSPPPSRNVVEEAANTPAFSISGDIPPEASTRGARQGSKRPPISASLGEASTGPASTSVSTSVRGQKRRAEEVDDNPTSDASPTLAPQPSAAAAASTEPTLAPRRRKRARRAPSPFRWIPDSLKLFDLTRVGKSTPKPLPPVQPYQDPQSQVYEERDSYDVNAGNRPYHPAEWRGKLPGPALMKDGAMKMGGTLLVF